MKNKNNPLGIPDLTPMLEKVTAYVKKAQGDKGYIDTQDREADAIYSITLDETQTKVVEMMVHGVRVNENGELQIVQKPVMRSYFEEMTEEDFKTADWRNIQYDDCVYYIPTLFNIAEFIREYAAH